MYYAKVSCANTFECSFNPPNASPLRSHSPRLCLSDRGGENRCLSSRWEEREEERSPKQSWDERLEGKQVSVLLVD